MNRKKRREVHIDAKIFIVSCIMNIHIYIYTYYVFSCIKPGYLQLKHGSVTIFRYLSEKRTWWACLCSSTTRDLDLSVFGACNVTSNPHEDSHIIAAATKPLADIPSYWLVYRDPYFGLWNNPHINWVVFYPLYVLVTISLSVFH